MQHPKLFAVSALLLACSLSARAEDSTLPPPPPPYQQDASLEAPPPPPDMAPPGQALAGEHDEATGKPPFAPGPQGGHGRHPQMPPLAVVLEPSLLSLALDSRQQSLWLKAEQADASEAVAQRRGMQLAALNLRVKLADPRLSLSQALRAATQSAPGLQPSPQWLAFFDSLNSKQASLVRQMLQSAPQPPHGMPPLPLG